MNSAYLLLAFVARKRLNRCFLHSLDPVVTAPLMAGHEDCVADVMDYVEDHE